MKKSIIAAVAAIAIGSAMAQTRTEQDYVQLQAAQKYNLVLTPGSTFEPDFVAGTAYTWEELALVMIDFNLQRGHNERANYWSLALKDKAYYFFGG